MSTHLHQLMQNLWYTGKGFKNFTGLNINVNYMHWLSWDNTHHWYCSKTSIYVCDNMLWYSTSPRQKNIISGAENFYTTFKGCNQSQQRVPWPLAESRVTRGSSDSDISSQVMRETYGKKLSTERLWIFTWVPWWQHKKVSFVTWVTWRHKK